MKRFCLPVLCSLLCFASCEQKPSSPSRLVKKRQLVFVQDPVKSKENRQWPDTSYLNILFQSKGLVNIHDLDSSIRVNLRYADTANFLHAGFYDGLKTAYLTCEAAIKLSNAQSFLRAADSNLVLLVLDASRPLHIQKMMWDSLKLPPLKKYQYLSPPSEPSLHNYGCAVDVTLFDIVTGKELDMGSAYDEFTKRSEPAMEKQLLNSGDLSEEAYSNRKLLRKVMERAGYKPIATEWWHFSICTKPEAQKRFDLIR